MDPLMEKFAVKFHEILVKFTSGMDAFEYKGKPIGLGILLINYIGTNHNCTMTDISNFLKVIPSTSTRRVQKLVNLSLVSRSMADNDRRLITLSLTPEGLELYHTYLKRRLEGMNELLDNFTAEEIETFLSILDFFIKFNTKLS